VKLVQRLLFIPILALVVGCPAVGPVGPSFTFDVTADMREFVGETGFKGAVRSLSRVGIGEFMVSPGDIDPPGAVYAVIQEVLGTGYDWYPVVGNHEAETPEDMAWLRDFNPTGSDLPRIVNTGPALTIQTCYSFDEGNAHFVVINEYFDGSVDYDPVGDVSPELLTWLETDLTATTQPIIFVLGHEPAFPQPDMAPPHRLRHFGDSLDFNPIGRDAFWQTLVDHGVTAYICGHTHNYSVIEVDGVWQIDAGHARGLADTGAASTFMKISVSEAGEVFYQTWRQNTLIGGYRLRDQGWL
jgi:hypothetical protein